MYLEKKIFKNNSNKKNFRFVFLDQSKRREKKIQYYFNLGLIHIHIMKILKVHNLSKPIIITSDFLSNQIYGVVDMIFDHSYSDKVYPLPENWPKIPQIFRRKSCELTKNTSPCVNKAVSHLELIQGIIEEWFKEKEEESKEQTIPLRPGTVCGLIVEYLRFGAEMMHYLT